MLSLLANDFVAVRTKKIEQFFFLIDQLTKTSLDVRCYLLKNERFEFIKLPSLAEDTISFICRRRKYFDCLLPFP
jgi:hypothetical protein